MARIRLKGINKVTTKLADGRTVTYWYAWKGGPRLTGKPGSPEFVDSFNEAVASRKAPPQGVLRAILHRYQTNPKFRALSERTRADYTDKLRIVEAQFGDFPLTGLADPRARRVFLDWGDKLAERSPKQADYTMAVFGIALGWARDRALIATNPLERRPKLYAGNRRDRIWAEADEAAFLAVAPGMLQAAYWLAVKTAQRQGDLTRLRWSDYDGTHIRLQQRKTSARVAIPLGAGLKALLDGLPKTAITILTNNEGCPYTTESFRNAWRRVSTRAGIIGLTFHDLRGTAVTRLALTGCTTAEIAAITGHSLNDVGAILDAHYLHRDPALARNAIAKLEEYEARTKIPKRAPKRANAASGEEPETKIGSEAWGDPAEDGADGSVIRASSA